MLKTHITACLLTTALMAAPALAQTSTTTAPATPAPAGSSMNPGTTNVSPNSNMSAGGSAMATQGEFITQRAPGMIRASELIGMDVRGGDNEDIGEIGDVLLDRSGQAQAVVIDIGGFLGIGETHVAIPMQSLQFRSSNQDAAATGSVNTAPAGSAGQNNAATTNNQNQAASGADAGNQRPDMVVVVMTKDQLKNAPKFEDRNRGSGAGNTTGSATGGNAPAVGTTTTAPKQ